jgi:hypothetical protein
VSFDQKRANQLLRATGQEKVNDQAAEDGLVAFAGALLLAVIGLGPGAFRHGLSGAPDEGLAQKLWGVQPNQF